MGLWVPLLRQPPAWPSGRGGYTFAAWMRVESFPTQAQGGGGVALFALRTASGLGVAAELRPGGVDVSTFSPGGGGATSVAKAEVRDTRHFHVHSHHPTC